MKIKSIKRIPFKGMVYNLGIADDESYVANGIVVHNCRCTWIPITRLEVEDEVKAGRGIKVSTRDDFPPDFPDPGFKSFSEGQGDIDTYQIPEGEIDRWITTETGVRIPIRKGQTVAEAIKERTGKVGGSEENRLIINKVSSSFDPEELNSKWLEGRRRYNKKLLKEGGKAGKLVEILTEGNRTAVLTGEGEPDLNLLITNKAKLEVPKRDSRIFMEGEPSQCHKNVSKLFKKNEIDYIKTGYALADDGGWRQHSWGEKDDKIVETTYKFSLYYGIKLNKKESMGFVRGNI